MTSLLHRASQIVAAVLASAVFWYLALALAGVAAFASGVSLQYGIGYGLMAGGLLILLGAEMIRSGIKRA